jgi:hypothetical protein
MIREGQSFQIWLTDIQYSKVLKIHKYFPATQNDITYESAYVLLYWSVDPAATYLQHKQNKR